MFLFISDRIEGETAWISGEEAMHAIKVLRMKEGDSMLVTSLDGVMHEAVAETISREELSARIVRSYPDWGKRNYYLRICIAPTKNIDRYEWFLEKAVEIGIDRITPVCCEHSERKQVKLERGLKVIKAAVKQSMKASMPVLDEMTDLSELMAERHTEEDSLFIAHCDECSQRVDVRELMKPGGKYTILIGPEGDFSQNEIAAASEKGYRQVSFGESRLRTETAGVWAVALTSIVN